MYSGLYHLRLARIGSVVLDFEDELGAFVLGALFEIFGQSGSRLAVFESLGAHLLEIGRLYVRDTFVRRTVQNDEFVVGRHVDIEFSSVSAEVLSRFERGDRVLRAFRLGRIPVSSVRDHLRVVGRRVASVVVVDGGVVVRT